ncbi:MAG TPA: peptidoglycan-binding protein, partial [Gammaproteobacteria bacterium]|nr:peptidoglycan-binding protein [Gammaproteobacteria bacterium]
MRHRLQFFIQYFVLLCLISSFARAVETFDFTQSTISLAEKNYSALEAMLPLYEKATITSWPMITSRVKLQSGVKSVSVMALRGRLKATGDLLPQNDTGMTLYDHALSEAVKHFQARHGLNPDGIVGNETLYQLNISPEERLHQIKVNMERWAKLSNEMGDRYILVNVPDYRLDLIENGQSILNM